jgi:hypothetical protein
LGAFYAPSEKSLDLAEPFGDDSELAIMWRDFERGIDEKTFLPLAVIDRTFDDVVEELINGVLGRKRGFQAAKPHPGRSVRVSTEVYGGNAPERRIRPKDLWPYRQVERWHLEVDETSSWRR